MSDPSAHITHDLTTVHQAFVHVMADVQGIAKKDQNTQQRFHFRGIDAVMNAVGPALREHGVVIIPQALNISTERYESKGGAGMKNSTVHMQYTVYGPHGDHFVGSAYGEAADSGDKSVSKAQSVAYRTFLLQGLTVPTQEPDPDSSVHERAAVQLSPIAQVKNELAELLTGANIDLMGFASWALTPHGGSVNISATDSVPAIRTLIDRVKADTDTIRGEVTGA
ncbi:ERF family protein [Rhodococcus jostii]|uniref:ERF family protein n=1 Tax=Rhodococcus jostii TaxID=132919 RepID=UPI00362D5A8B